MPKHGSFLCHPERKRRIFAPLIEKGFFVTAFLRMTYTEGAPERIQDFYQVFAKKSRQHSSSGTGCAAVVFDSLCLFDKPFAAFRAGDVDFSAFAGNADGLLAFRAAEIAVFPVGQARPKLTEFAILLLTRIDVAREHPKNSEAEQSEHQQIEDRVQNSDVYKGISENQRQKRIGKADRNRCNQEYNIALVGTVAPVHKFADGFTEASEHIYHLRIIINLLLIFTRATGKNLRFVYEFGFFRQSTDSCGRLNRRKRTPLKPRPRLTYNAVPFFR